ncbi:adhesion G protein-coupled receptor E1-like [Sycon ciliatum]|uniref:adhesion G protein-coupled receptor E1-like n=1 Tax=Sycon ciliatum TaxID=27933 RepID=UPI0031F60B69
MAKESTSGGTFNADTPTRNFSQELVDRCNGISTFQCYSNKGKTDYFCQCQAGFVYDGNTCVSILVCNPENRTMACNKYPVCQLNQRSSAYECGCRTGLKLGSHLCELADECLEGTHACHVNASCHNTEANYTCSCKPGFTGADLECSDIDECRSVNVTCENHSTCINSVGSYSCECNAGFITSNSSSPTDDDVMCLDNNECITITTTCGFNSKCINSIGSYFCACYAGFVASMPSTELGEQDCVNVNECLSQPCNHGYKCLDTIGSFSCVCNDDTPLSNGTHCFRLPSNTGHSDTATEALTSLTMIAMYASLGVVYIAVCILGVLLCKSRRDRKLTLLKASLTSGHDKRSSQEDYSRHIVQGNCGASTGVAELPATTELPMGPIFSSNDCDGCDAVYECPEEMDNMVDNDAYGVREG